MNAPADLPMLRLPRDRLDALLASADWRHLRPVLRAVRDHKIGLVMLLPGGEPVDLARMLAKRPTVVIVGDDAGFAFGPAGFDPNVLQAAFTAAELVVMVAGAPELALYERAATFTALTRRHSVIVETQHEAEADWLALAARYTVAGAA